MGFIYIVNSKYSKENIYKIGKSKNIKSKTNNRYTIPYGSPQFYLYKTVSNHDLAESIIWDKILATYRYDNTELFHGDINIFIYICKLVCMLIDKNKITNTSLKANNYSEYIWIKHLMNDHDYD